MQNRQDAILALILVGMIPTVSILVSFGTDAGYFSDKGYSTVVFGPGSINRAHKPNEYIKVTELKQGLDFFENVTKYLSN